MTTSRLNRFPLMRMTQQRGSTFLGVIVGVLVGLAAALAVAVYVTNVPIPFVNKGASRGAEHDAAETKKNKDWDPNGQLAGKTPKVAAAAASAAASEAAGETKTGDKTADKSTEKADKAAEKAAEKAAAKAAEKAAAEKVAAEKAGDKTADKPVPAKAEAPKAEIESKPKAASGDPLGDLAKSRTKPGAEVDPFIYFVQVGAFRTPEDAEAQKAKLSLAGVDAKVTEREVSGRTVFRVRVGPLDKKEDADKSKERIEALGVDAQLVRANR
jgi:cell division protein FtsN